MISLGKLGKDRYRIENILFSALLEVGLSERYASRITFRRKRDKDRMSSKVRLD